MSFTNDPALTVNQLPVSLDLPDTYQEAHETLSILLKRMIDTINTKEGSLYTLQELGNFQLYYNLSNTQVFINVYRMVFDMVALNAGPIAAGATVSVAHNIVGITRTTRIYGSATNSDAPVKYLPLPYVSATLVTDQVQIYLTPTNVVLVNGATQSILTSASIVAEYVKN